MEDDIKENKMTDFNPSPLWRMGGGVQKDSKFQASNHGLVPSGMTTFHLGTRFSELSQKTKDTYHSEITRFLPYQETKVKDHQNRCPKYLGN